VTGFVLVQGRERSLVGRPGLALGERLRLVVVPETVGRVGVGLRPPAGSAEMPRPKAVSHHAEGSGLWP
jgi:hypothetical protein